MLKNNKIKKERGKEMKKFLEGLNKGELHVFAHIVIDTINCATQEESKELRKRIDEFDDTYFIPPYIMQLLYALMRDNEEYDECLTGMRNVLLETINKYL